MTRVAIIGGGIGGLTAANALTRAGIEVAVYEAAGELKEIGAGVALHPNAMRVLRSIGVEDAVRGIAGRSQWQWTRAWTGRVIARSTPAQQAASFGLTGATVHRADLLDVLAAALPEGIVTLGKRCTEVLPGGDADPPVARFADGSEATADVIIGADGIHSVVRTALFGPDAPRFTGKICYRSVIPAAAVAGKQVNTDGAQWFGPHGTIVVYPLRGTDLLNVVCHYDDDGYRHESWVTECEGAEVLERYGLADHADHPAHLLSGGQKQLLAIAGVLVMRPARIVFDEPTTLLDLVNTRRVARVIEELEQQVVVVTHDLDLLDGFDRVLVVDGGRVVADGAPDSSVGAYRELMVHR